VSSRVSNYSPIYSIKLHWFLQVPRKEVACDEKLKTFVLNLSHNLTF
jgi:hypothetical protein